MKRDSLKKGGDSMYLRRKASPNYKTISQGKKRTWNNSRRSLSILNIW